MKASAPVLALAALLLPTLVSGFSRGQGPPSKASFHPAGWEKHPHCPPEVALGNSTFEQLIDHDNPHLGTFSQFYYYSSQFYKGPGSPIILFTPGEINVTGQSMVQYAVTSNRLC